MKKSVLTLGILTWFLFAGNHAVQANASAEQPVVHPEQEQNTAATELSTPTIYVEVPGQKDSLPGVYNGERIGFGRLGNRSIMETPMTAYVLNERALEDYAEPHGPVNGILRNIPSVKAGESLMFNDFSIRGHYLQGASFYVNGIPGLYSQMISPTYNAEKIELVSGPSMIGGTQMEKNAVAGYVNFVSKKAKEKPNLSFKQTFSGRGHWGEYLDIGRRFGKNNEWGVRVNAAVSNGETAIRDTRLNTKGIFINLDHEGKNSSSNLLLGYQYHKVSGGGQRRFTKGKKVTQWPSPPDLSSNIGFGQMLKEENEKLLAFNHKQNITKNLNVFLNIGLLDSDLERNISPEKSAYEMINDKGDYQFKTRNGRTPNKYSYYGLGLSQKFFVNGAENQLTLAVDHIGQKTYTNTTTKKVSSKLFSGNIYRGMPSIPAQNFPYIDKKLSRETSLNGIALTDSIKMDKLQLTIGVHHHKADLKQYDINGVQTKRITADTTSPIFGVLYRPTKELTWYASHTEAFSKGDTVGSGYVNEGEMLAPAKAKENEIGVKWLRGTDYVALSLFDIREQGYIDETRAAGKYRTPNGEDQFRGAELSFTHDINAKWSLFGGAMYVNAVRSKTQGGTLDGRKAEGSSFWNGVLGVNYRADRNTELFARMLSNGKMYTYNQSITLPGYTTFDVGVRHKCKVGDTDMTIVAACYNVTGKDYWMTRSRGAEVILGTPRTFMLSTKFDL